MAKVSTTVTAVIDAARRPFYKWLVPGVFYDQLHTVLHDAAFLPGVVRTTGTSGPWDVPGSYRTIHLTDGNTVREQVTAADTPDSFAYVVTDFTSGMIRRMVKEARGKWRFTDNGKGTNIEWTYTAESKAWWSMIILYPVIKILWNRYMKAGVRIIQERAPKEVPRNS